jgi:hypothetical protein
MAITNLDKPTTGTPQTELNIGDGFNLLVGGVYKLITGALGTGGMTNKARAVGYETWASILTTWATETQTWLDMGSIYTNVVMSSTNPLWNARSFPWTLTAPWQSTNAGITNVNKP